MVLINDFKGWNKLEYAWLIVATATITGLSIYWQDTWLGIISAITNVVCVILVQKGKITNYVWGFIGCLTYGYISYSKGYNGDASLNLLYFLPAQIVGYYKWNKNSDKQYKKLTKQQGVLLAIGLFAGVIIYSVVLYMLKGTLPIVDAISTVLSIVAMVLMVKKHIAQWYLWIMVNIVSIVMWVYIFVTNGDSISTLLMWVVFLINSVVGLYQWQKAGNKQLQG